MMGFLREEERVMDLMPTQEFLGVHFSCLFFFLFKLRTSG